MTRARSIRRFAPTRAWVVWLLAFMLFPSASEALIDIGHTIVTGHAAHDDSAEAHDHEQTDEHGCSGLFHTCRCCPSPGVLAAVTATFDVSLDEAGPHFARWIVVARSLDAHTEPPFRPPAS